MKIIQLTQADVPTIRGVILEDQSGICPICKGKPTRPVLDHDHTKRIKGSGLVRGVLCSTCNVFLAKIENNVTRYKLVQRRLPEILHNIADYLAQDQHPYVHPTEKGKVSYKKLQEKLTREETK